MGTVSNFAHLRKGGQDARMHYLTGPVSLSSLISLTPSSSVNTRSGKDSSFHFVLVPVVCTQFFFSGHTHETRRRQSRLRYPGTAR